MDPHGVLQCHLCVGSPAYTTAYTTTTFPLLIFAAVAAAVVAVLLVYKYQRRQRTALCNSRVQLVMLAKAWVTARQDKKAATRPEPQDGVTVRKNPLAAPHIGALGLTPRDMQQDPPVCGTR